MPFELGSYITSVKKFIFDSKMGDVLITPFLSAIFITLIVLLMNIYQDPDTYSFYFLIFFFVLFIIVFRDAILYNKIKAMTQNSISSDPLYAPKLSNINTFGNTDELDDIFSNAKQPLNQPTITPPNIHPSNTTQFNTNTYNPINNTDTSINNTPNDINIKISH